MASVHGYNAATWIGRCFVAPNGMAITLRIHRCSRTLLRCPSGAAIRLSAMGAMALQNSRLV